MSTRVTCTCSHSNGISFAARKECFRLKIRKRCMYCVVELLRRAAQDEKLEENIAMTEFQKRIVETIERHSSNGSISQTRICRIMGVPNVGVYNSLSALHRQGVVGCFVDDGGIFAARYWFLRRDAAPVAPVTLEIVEAGK